MKKHVVTCTQCGKSEPLYTYETVTTHICDDCRAQILERERMQAATEIIRHKIGERYTGFSFEGLDITQYSPEYRSPYREAIAYLRELPGKKSINSITSLVGTNGTGKTTLASCLIFECYAKKVRSQYVKAKIFLDYVKKHAYSPRYEERDEAAYRMQQVKDVPVLVIDECHIVAGTKEDVSLLYEIIDHRDSQYLQTVLIGNMENSVKSFINFFGVELTDRIRRTGNRIFHLAGRSMRVLA